MLVNEETALYTRMVVTEQQIVEQLEELPSDPADVRRDLLLFPTYFERNASDPAALVELGAAYVRVHVGTTVTGEEGKPDRPKGLMLLAREYICMRVIMSLGLDAGQSAHDYEQQFDSQIFLAFGDSAHRMQWDQYRELLALFKQAYFKIHRSLAPTQARMQSRSSTSRKRAPRKSRM